MCTIFIEEVFVRIHDGIALKLLCKCGRIYHNIKTMECSIA